MELAVLRVPRGYGLSSVWRQGWRYLLCSGRSVGSNDVFHLSPLLPLNKEWGMGESAAQLHPVLAEVKQPGLFFSQREVLQEEDSQAGRGHLRCNRHPRLTLQVSDAGISLPKITLHTSPRMAFRIARLSVAKEELPSSSPNSLLCLAPCRTDDKAASKARCWGGGRPSLLWDPTIH